MFTAASDAEVREVKDQVKRRDSGAEVASRGRGDGVRGGKSGRNGRKKSEYVPSPLSNPREQANGNGGKKHEWRATNANA